ncbi:hypothetical protein EVG20_g7088 [Dentipellis fragilis]|uniref:DUF1783-domain-containing protein n=1 Tax=Dentipellis fragilis TaxID=205917 RepID=A0A4Y9YHM4_9AGAM|nr:hypothetical protein EVG20_g7088 [Dentipellis fragilis]
MHAARALPKARLPARLLSCRTFATELPRPPPSEMPAAETFSSPSKPREYYTRRQQRDLPPYARTWPLVAVFGTAGVAVWASFFMYATNQERLSSSVTRHVLTTIRESDAVREVLGDAVRFEPAWYLNGDPWVSGSVNMLQGHVDISFRVKGHKQGGTLYFTSLRKAKGEPFTILRFKIIADDGTIVKVPLATL